jgi:hypothetical protein
MSLAEFAGPGRLDIAARAALISSVLQSRPIVDDDPVLGAGLVLWEKELFPVVVVEKERVVSGAGHWPLQEVSEAYQIIRLALGRPDPEWLSEVGSVTGSAITTPIDRTRPSPAGRPTRPMLSTGSRRNWRRNAQRRTYRYDRTSW